MFGNSGIPSQSQRLSSFTQAAEFSPVMVVSVMPVDNIADHSFAQINFAFESASPDLSDVSAKVISPEKIGQTPESAGQEPSVPGEKEVIPRPESQAENMAR